MCFMFLFNVALYKVIELYIPQNIVFSVLAVNTRPLLYVSLAETL